MAISTALGHIMERYMSEGAIMILTILPWEDRSVGNRSWRCGEN